MRNVPLFLALSGAVLLIALVVAGCSSDDESDASTGAPGAASDQAAGEGSAAAAGYVIQQPFDSSIVFTSPVFNDTRRIPKRSTCTAISANEPNISPALAWEGLPEGTVSLALTMDSLEVEGGPRVHWIMWNMPPSLTELTEGIAQADVLPDGTAQGANGAGGVGYLGPCPPVMVSTFGQQGSMGETKKRDIEKYFFKLYALDVQLDLPPSTTKDDLLKAMDGHILAAGELVGERQGEISRREH